jgi:hypothetical protein
MTQKAEKARVGSSRLPTWSVWALLGLISIEIAFAVSLATRGSGTGSAPAASATVIFVLATATVGTLIGLRRPGNRVGSLLRFAAFSFATGALIVTYVEVALLVEPGSLPVGPLLVWLGDLMFGLGFGVSGTFLLLLFPTGSLPSPRWRVVAWMASIGIAAQAASVILGSSAFEGLPIQNPVALDDSSPLLLTLEGGGFYLLVVAILASVASLVVRYRRSVGEERQQLKWVAFGVVLLGLGVAGSALLELVNGSAEVSDDMENFVIAASLTMVPISIGFAIMRYRLYDIDRIISRTVSYGVLTALLAGVYVGFVFVLRELLPFEGGLPVAFSTLAVAGVFNPLRLSVQAFVDRRFNRSRYDSARLIAGYTQRLSTEVDLDRLGDDLQSVAVETMQPASISLWLRDSK